MLQRLQKLRERMERMRPLVNGQFTTFVEERVDDALERLESAGVLTEYGQEPDLQSIRDYHDNTPLRPFMFLGVHIPTRLTCYMYPKLLLRASARRWGQLGMRPHGKSAFLKGN